MSRLIDADTPIHVQIYDDMTEEWSLKETTVASALDYWADEGCPPTVDAVPVVQRRFGILAICALRYCQGRRTYMPSLVQQIVGSHLSELSDEDINVMVEDCQFQRRMNLYGDDCDKVDWLKWEEKVTAERNRRKKKEE